MQALITVAILVALAIGVIACSSSPRAVCDVEVVAPHIPALVAAVERRDYLALASIIDAIGHERAVCALKQVPRTPDAGTDSKEQSP